MRTVYLNGQFIPEADAKLSIYDLSVMQAAAAFEMTRSFNGQHFKLTEHLLRLEQSCRLLSIPFPWKVEQLIDLCQNVADRNDHGPGEEHRLLIVVSPGCAPMYKDLDGVIPHPFLYIADFPLRYTVRGFSKYFTEGVHCVTSKIQQVPDACVPSAAKHRSRLHFHLAQMQAPAGTWPILVDDGDLIEAPGANLISVFPEFWDEESEAMVPPLIMGHNRQALQGISMQTVRELCRKNFDYESHCPSEWKRCELWLTGTPFCALSVVSLDGKPIGDGKPGPVYKAMMEKWNNLVGLDIAQQIINWDAECR